MGFLAVVETEAQGVLAFPSAFTLLKLSRDLPYAATTAEKRLGTRQGHGRISLVQWPLGEGAEHLKFHNAYCLKIR